MYRLFFLLLVGALIYPGYCGGKKKTIYTYLTEGWYERDYLGAGFHIVTDHTAPNIWVEVHKVEGEISDAVGLPNDVMAGKLTMGAYWSGQPYDLLNPYTRVDWSKAVCPADVNTGNCQAGSGCRCFGDWVNQDELWYDPDAYPGNAQFFDKDGRSFLVLKPEIHGQKRTRYRFTVYVQDNTPIWYKTPAGAYNTGAASTGAEKFFPLKKVVFRLSDFSNPPGINRSSDAEDDSKDEFWLEKTGDDFKVQEVPPEFRVKWGKYTYSFTTYHTFKFAQDYMIQVTAEDMEGNRRTLRAGISMGGLGGLQIHNRAVDTQKSTY
jgi:hypothetical protein